MARSNARIVRSDFTDLHRFVRAITDGNGLVVKVGIFGSDKGAPPRKTAGAFSTYLKRRMKTLKNAAQTNAEIGAIHEFGSYARGIPKRSWLRMPLHQRSRQIIQNAGQGAMQLLKAGQIIKVLQRLGIACEDAIQEAFETRGFGKWAKNSEATIRRKGSDAPLIDTAQLRRAVVSKVEKKS